jgi:hypothetical protein
MSDHETPSHRVSPSPAAQPPAAAPTALPYAETTDPDYPIWAARFEAQPTRGGAILRGPCPRCADSMEFPVVDKVYKSIRKPSAAARQQASEDLVVQMICTCSVAHPGAPQGLPGCGAYWNLQVGAGAS